MQRLSAGILASAILLLGAAIPRANAQPRVAALPIYSAATAKAFGLFQPIAVSPTGKYIAFTSCDKRRHAGAAAQRGATSYFGAAGCDIEMVSLADKSTVAVASGADNAFPVWSPDGRYLAFLSDRSGTNQLYVWDVTSRSVRRVVDTPMDSGTSPWWSHDSNTVLVTLAPPAVKVVPGAASSDVLSSGPIIKGAAVTVFRSPQNLTAAEAAKTKNTAAASPLLSIDTFNGSLAAVMISNGNVRMILHNGRIDSFSCSGSPDGRSVACGSPVGFSNDNGAALLSDILLIDLDDGTYHTLARRNPNASSSNWKLDFSWSPDSRFLAWRGSSHSPADISAYDMRDHRLTVSNFGAASVGAIEPTDVAGSSPLGGITWIGGTGKFVLIAVPGDWRQPAMAQPPQTNWIWQGSIEGGTMRRALTIPGQHMENIFSTGDGNRALVQTFQLSDYGTAWYTLNLSTLAYTKVHSEQAMLSNITFAANHSIFAYYKESADQSPDVWIASPVTLNGKRVTRLNPFFDDYVLGKARLISWHTADGLPLRGALMLPSDYVAGRRYPMVVYPYGSEYKSLQVNNFGFSEERDNVEDLQTLATRGYAILLPDAPVRIGTPMWDIAKTIMPGVDRAIALGYADPNRVGVMGHSYGGFTVMALITQTTRFRAAISRAGFSDWTSSYSEMASDGTAYGIRQAETFYGLGNGGPWKILDRFISQSPFYHFDRVTTPVLIIHGSGDTAVASYNADMSFVALRHLHKDVAYAKYANVDHVEGLWPFPDQLDYMTRMVNWFDRYLCPNRQSPTNC